MSGQIKHHARLVNAALIFSVLSSIPILLCALTTAQNEDIFLILIPILFWGGLLAEQILIWRANAVLKHILGTGQVRRVRCRPGIISPFQSVLGWVADGVLVVALLVIVILMIGHGDADWLQFIFLFLIVLSFRVHCIANGKNYWYKKYLSNKEGLTV